MTTTTLDQALNDYLSVRRAMGYKLAEHGRQLPNFVAYLDAAGASTVTTELAVAWATQPIGCSPVRWAQRLAMVRGLTRHLKAIDPDTEIPPLGVLPHGCRRVAPYLYSDADIAALLAAARALPSQLRASTYETLVGLLAVTGMRSGRRSVSTATTSTGTRGKARNGYPVCTWAGTGPVEIRAVGGGRRRSGRTGMAGHDAAQRRRSHRRGREDPQPPEVRGAEPFEVVASKWEDQASQLRQLNHPGIVGVQEAFVAGPPHPPGSDPPAEPRTLYFVMNWVQGLDLTTWASEHPRPADRLAILESAASGLDALHAAGHVHADIKPSNVRVRETGPDPSRPLYTAVLVDFGLRRTVTGERPSMIAGDAAGCGDRRRLGPSHRPPGGRRRVRTTDYS